jgi:hypothetical protein
MRELAAAMPFAAVLGIQVSAAPKEEVHGRVAVVISTRAVVTRC